MNADLISGIRHAAMDLLARREHSARELTDKLERRFGPCEEIALVLERLSSDKLQDDRRFAEALLRSRLQRGQGPLRVAAELKQRGVEASIRDAVLDADDPAWLDVASQALGKRFGAVAATDVKERARRARFLERRGFTHQQVRQAMDREPSPA